MGRVFALSSGLASIGTQPPALRPATVTLRFPLPPALLLRAEPGRWSPCLHGVRLDVEGDGTVAIGGYDAMATHAARAVMDQALRFLTAIGRGGPALAPQSCVGALSAPDTGQSDELYRIVTGAGVAIVRTIDAPMLLPSTPALA